MGLYILYTAHLGGCFSFFIGRSECSSKGYCWLSRSNLIDAPIIDQYISSFYIFISTMSTVGYGNNMVPVTAAEKTYQIFLMLLSCALFAFIIGSLGQLLSKFYDSELEFKNKIMYINKSLEENEVDEVLRNKIKAYLEFKLERKIAEKIDEEEIFGLLNTNLLEEIKLEINGQLLFNFGYFNNFEKILVFVTRLLHSEILAKNETVFEVSTICL